MTNKQWWCPGCKKWCTDEEIEYDDINDMDVCPNCGAFTVDIKDLPPTEKLDYVRLMNEYISTVQKSKKYPPVYTIHLEYWGPLIGQWLNERMKKEGK